MTEDLLSLLADNDLELHDFGAADREFLRAVHEEGEARTSDIRGYGLERQQIHYRYDSLTEDGLIEVSRVGLEDHDGRKQNVATLSDLGKQLVEAGLLDEVTDSNTNLEELKRRFERLREDAGDSLQQVDRNHRVLVDRMDSMETQIEDLEDRLTRLERQQQVATESR